MCGLNRTHHSLQGQFLLQLQSGKGTLTPRIRLREFSRILGHEAGFGQEAFQNFPQISHSHSSSNLSSHSKDQYAHKVLPPVPLPSQVVRLSQRLYSSLGKCISLEIHKCGMSLGLSGQGNFPVFPTTRGRNDGSQTSKDSGILPLQRCSDEEKG